LAYILNIETATTVCSVSVSDQSKTLAFKETDNGFTHAENLHVFIDEVLEESGIGIKSLHAVAVSRGPGSYTGLRIGTSAAKGLAYALKIPLLSVDTLAIMTLAAKDIIQDGDLYCPLLDARRMEVYTCGYNNAMVQTFPTEALIVDEQSVQKFKGKKVCFFGEGMEKCKSILKTLENVHFIENIKPSTIKMAELSFKNYADKKFEDVAYFEPFYLKDFLIHKKKA